MPKDKDAYLDTQRQAFTNEDLFDKFTLQVKIDRLTAGIPSNRKLLQAWAEANEAPKSSVLGGGTEDQEAMLERLDPTETHSVIFYRDLDGRPCYESRCMKAAFKEGANVMKEMLKIKNLRSKLEERVFVWPRLVPIKSKVQQDERPISVMTAQGPRTSIKRYEYADDVELTFTVKVLKDGLITEPLLRSILAYLEDNGLGSDRSQGSGTFQVVSFQPASEVRRTRIEATSVR